MKDNKYLISFLVLGYKVEKYIQECLDSIIQQYNPNNIEYQICICVDKSYENDSESIFLKYKNKYSFIKLIFEDMANTKISQSRNALFDNANGEYFTFVDGDDFISTQMMHKVADVLKEKRPNILSTPIYQYHNLHSDSIHCLWGRPELLQGELLEIDLTQPLNLSFELKYPGLHGRFFKSNLIKDFKFHPNFLEDDKPLIHFLYRSSKTALYLNVLSVFYRLHSGGLMSSIKKEKKFSIQYNDIILYFQNQQKFIESFLKQKNGEEINQYISNYMILTISLYYIFHMYSYFHKDLHYFKTKKMVNAILSASHQYYLNFLIPKDPVLERECKLLYAIIDTAFYRFYADGAKAKQFLLTHNKRFRYIIHKIDFVKKIVFFYK